MTTWRRRTCGCGRARTRPRSSLRRRRWPAGIRGSGRTAASVFVDSSAQVTGTERAIRPLAVALALFAALAGLISLAVIGPAAGPSDALDAAGYGVLSALGMTRGGLLALAAARLALVTVAGGAIAVASRSRAARR